MELLCKQFYLCVYVYSFFFTSQTSRIEIKKGPNGIDYEYEYVYYYYDDDEKDSGSKKTATVTTDEKFIENQNGGKNRYDKSTTTTKPNVDRNELPTSRGKGRQSIPVTEESVEERLPANTRFPPRSAITPPSSVQVVSNVDETTKKISVKRPSLELVDSQSFNRGEKGQSKSRVLENEFGKVNDARLNENSYAPSSPQSTTYLYDDISRNIHNGIPVSRNNHNANTESIPQIPDINDATTLSNDNDESTTQIMDKVALDLYAHLVNENSNIDASTGSIQFDEFSTSDNLVNPARRNNMRKNN